MNELTPDEIEVIKLVKDRYSKIDRFNPFHRRGITADDIAYGMNWYTGKTLSSGVMQADLPKVKKIIKELIKKGYLIEAGRDRTLSAGSKYKVIYAPSEELKEEN